MQCPKGSVTQQMHSSPVQSQWNFSPYLSKLLRLAEVSFREVRLTSVFCNMAKATQRQCRGKIKART